MLEALERCGSVQTRAAELLGMTFRSFRYFAKKYELTVQREPDDGPDIEVPADAVDTKAMAGGGA